jgi:hypothetical protein
MEHTDRVSRRLNFYRSETVLSFAVQRQTHLLTVRLNAWSATAMGRYYFDVVHLNKKLADREGSDLADDTAAQNEGRETTREIVAEYIRKGEKIDDDFLQIRDENGGIVAKLLFRDILI